MFDANSITKFAWGASVDTRLAIMPWIPINPDAARRHICDDFLRQRLQECLWLQYNRHNTLVNTKVNFQDERRDGLVTQ